MNLEFRLLFLLKKVSKYDQDGYVIILGNTYVYRNKPLLHFVDKLFCLDCVMQPFKILCI